MIDGLPNHPTGPGAPEPGPSALLLASSDMRRPVPVAVAALLAALALAPAAFAQEPAPVGDPDLAMVIDRITPDLPGITLTAEQTRVGPRFVLRNPTPAEVTVLSTVGDPLLRVGPDGAFGNLRSPEWFTAKSVGGAVPETAQDRGRPVWLRVSTDPAWGWFDQRLRASRGTAAKPLDVLARWTVPLTHGGVAGAIEGHVEFRPVRGTFTPRVRDAEPAPGVTVAAATGNPTPEATVDYTGAGEVVVLGAAGEPYLRLTPHGSAANAASPTWIAAQNPAAVTSTPAAQPRWTPTGPTPRVTFPLSSAGPGPDLTPYYAMTEPTVIGTWTLPLVVDGQRVDAIGTTTLTPAGYVEPWWHRWVLPAVATAGALLLAVIGLALLLRKRTRRKAATGARTERERAAVG